MAAVCTSVWPSPTPPSHKHPPPAAPRPKSPWTRASMTLYLTNIWCLALRFQLILASRLLRLRRCVPLLGRWLTSPGRLGGGTKASSVCMTRSRRNQGSQLNLPLVERADRPLPHRFPEHG